MKNRLRFRVRPFLVSRNPVPRSHVHLQLKYLPTYHHAHQWDRGFSGSHDLADIAGALMRMPKVGEHLFLKELYICVDLSPDGSSIELFSLSTIAVLPTLHTCNLAS